MVEFSDTSKYGIGYTDKMYKIQHNKLAIVIIDNKVKIW